MFRATPKIPEEKLIEGTQTEGVISIEPIPEGSVLLAYFTWGSGFDIGVYCTGTMLDGNRFRFLRPNSLKGFYIKALII